MSVSFFSRVVGAEFISVSEINTGLIGSAGDEEWYSLILEEDVSYTLTIDGTTLVDPELIGIFDGTATAISGSDRANDNDQTFEYTFTAPASRLYYVGVTGFQQGSIARTGTYSIQLEANDGGSSGGGSSTPDIGQTTDSAASLTVGSTAQGTVDVASDVDWFGVTLVSGVRYRFDISGSSVVGNTLTDPKMVGIYDSSGTLIPDTGNNNGGPNGRDARDYYTATFSGTHYIAATGNGTATGTYTVSATELSGGSSGGGSSGGDTGGSGSGDSGSGGSGGGVVDDPDPGSDIGATVGAAQVLQVGDTSRSAIETSGDQDWFLVSLSSGVRYRFDVTGSDSGDGTLTDPRIAAIYSADRIAISETTNNDGGDGLEARLYFSPSSTDLYYVAVAGNGTATGSYQIEIQETTGGSGDTGDSGGTGGNDDIGSTTASAAALAVNGSAQGTIEATADTDWFGVTLTQGVRYRIDIQGESSSAGSLVNPNLVGLYNSSGGVIAGTTNDNGGDGLDSRLYYTAEYSGAHYVSVGQRSSTTGTYTVNLVEWSGGSGGGGGTNVPDIGSTAATSQALDINTAASSTLHLSSDVDWFSVSLTQGVRYRIDITGESSGGGTLGNPYLQSLYDSGSVAIDGTTNDNGGEGLDSRLYFTATETATHYISVASRSATIGSYTVEIVEWSGGSGSGGDGGGGGGGGTPTVDTVGDTTATTGSLVVGDTVTASVIDTTDDVDWFAVTLTEGQRYRVDLRGYDTISGTLLDPEIGGIYTVDGTLIDSTANNNGGVGLNARRYFTADYTGTHYVAAQSRDDGTGSYELGIVEWSSSATDPDADDHSGSVEAPGSIRVNGSSSGIIETDGDFDWFRVALDSGRHYQIDVEGAESGTRSLIDPYFYGVRNAAGDTFAFSWDDNGGDGLNSRVVFTAPHAEFYYLVVGADGDGEGSYRLRVTEVDEGEGIGGSGRLADPADVPGGHPPVPETDDEAAAGIETSAGVSVGGTVLGRINASGDRDWYRISLEAGKHYQIDLGGDFTSDYPLYDSKLLSVRDAAGVRFHRAQDNDSGPGYGAQLIFTARETGDYYIEAGAEGTTNGDYRLSVVEVAQGAGIGSLLVTELFGDPDNPNPDDAGQGTFLAADLALGVSQARSIDIAGDSDWFRLNLDAGTGYRVRVDATSDDDAPNLTFYNALGQRITAVREEDDNDPDSATLQFMVPETGVYYVAAEQSHTVDYTISATKFSSPGGSVGEDYSADILTTGFVSKNGSTAGRINYPLDEDWLAMELQGGHSYKVHLTGEIVGATPATPDPFLFWVLNGYGQSVRVDDRDSLDGEDWVVLTPEYDGRYFVAVADASEATGGYRVSLEELGQVDEWGTTPEQAGYMSATQNAVGSLHTEGDRDWYALDVVAGYHYAFHEAGDEPYWERDVRVHAIRNADGSVAYSDESIFAFDEYGANVFGFVAQTTGRVYVDVGIAFEFDGTDPTTGDYEVEVIVTDASIDDEGSTTDTAAFVDASGVYNGRIDYIGDRDWVAVNVVEGTTYARTFDITDSDTDLNIIWNGYAGSEDHRTEIFTATSSETIYFQFEGQTDDVGDYRLTVAPIEGGNDVGATPGSAGTIALGVEVTGTTAVFDDADWYAITLNRGSIYHIDFDHTAEGTTRGSFKIRSDEGQYLAKTGAYFTAQETGVHHISIGENIDPGTYSVTITEYTGGDDFGHTAATAGSVAIGGTLTGEIDYSGDVDWVAVGVTEGQSYTFSLTGTGDSVNAKTEVEEVFYFDEDGVAETLFGGTLPVTGNGDGPASFGFTAGFTGLYYVPVSFVTGTGTYVASFDTTAPNDAIPAHPGSGTVLDMDTTLSSQIDAAGDVDWIRVSLQGGSTYRIEADGSNGLDVQITGVHTDVPSVLHNTADTDGGDGTDAEVTFTATLPGDYFIGVAGEHGTSGDYSLGITELLMSDDFASDASTLGAISPGGTVTGTVETADDRDWFAVDLTAGRNYQIDLRGSPTNDGTLTDTVIYGLFDSDGDLIPGSANDDGPDGLNSQVRVSVAETGTYFIEAGGYNSLIGSYTLAVADVGPVPTDSDFDIDLIYSGDDKYLPHIEAAAARWESLIVGDVEDAVSETLGLIDDISIRVSVGDMDGVGGTLGEGGVLESVVTEEGGIRVLRGTVFIDQADMDDLLIGGLADEVIVHEMAHALGFGGAVFDRLGLADGTSYTGANALREYNALISGSAGAVPLADPSVADAGSHWAEEVFDRELMTPQAENSEPMPISRVTLGAFEDLGYRVDYDQAEAVTITPLVLDSLIAPDGLVIEAEPDPVELPDDYAPWRFVHTGTGALDLAPGETAGAAFNGPVNYADSHEVGIYDTASGKLVILIGDFDKDNPSQASDVRGTVNRVKVIFGGLVEAEYEFPTARGIASVLVEGWSFDLARDNLIEVGTGIKEDDRIDAGDGDDAVQSGGGADSIAGGDGNDTLMGGAGADSLDGGRHEDVIYGAGGADTLIGGTHSDRLYGGTGADSLAGFGGDDLLQGDSGMDTLKGGNGHDILSGGDNDDQLAGGAGDDHLSGDEGNDTLNGEAGNDTLQGGAGADALNGGEGDDDLSGGEGNDTLETGGGNDTVSGGADDDVLVLNLAFGDVTVGPSVSGLTLINGAERITVQNDVETVRFTDGDKSFAELAEDVGTPIITGTSSGETLTGTIFDEVINGEAGGDWIYTGGGSDTVDGGRGRDMLDFGTLGNTPGRPDNAFRIDIDMGAGTAHNFDSSEVVTFTSIERVTSTIYNDRIKGTEGDDHIRALGHYDWIVATSGNDTYDGGTGKDMVSYSEWVGAAGNTGDVFGDTGAPPGGDDVSGIVLDLTNSANNTNLAEGHTLISIERITGTSHQDVFWGDDQSNDFRGLGGDDWFVGSEGGRERYFGGNGDDIVTYFNAAEGVSANLSGGAVVDGVQTGVGSGGIARKDIYYSIEGLIGSGFDDTLTGSDEVNTLSGLDGDDFLYGLGGDDTLKGGAGSDEIDGGAGRDVAIFDGAISDYTVTRLANKLVLVQGAGASDRLQDVEYFQFDDTTVDVWSLSILSGF